MDPKTNRFSDNLLVLATRGFQNYLHLFDESCFKVNIRGFRSSLFRKEPDTILVNDTTVVSKILKESYYEYPKGFFVARILKELTGKSIFSADGEQWGRYRRIIDRSFQLSGINERQDEIRGSAHDLIERLKKKSSGVDTVFSLDIERELTWTAADTIYRILFGVPLPESDFQKIAGAFSRYQDRARIGWTILSLVKSALFVSRFMRKDGAIIRDYVRLRIDEFFSSTERVEEASRMKSPPLIYILSSVVDEYTGTRLSEDELVDQATFLLLAGHETSASALGSACWLLATHPEVQESLREEYLTGHRQSSVMTLKHFVSFIKEVLRLYPPLPLLTRCPGFDNAVIDVPSDDTYRHMDSYPTRRGIGKTQTSSSNSIKCPVRAQIIISPWAIHRHESHWKKPNDFIPDRFLKDSQNKYSYQLKDNVWLPFSQGPRSCPGAGFAMTESIIILGSLLSSFRLVSPLKGRPQLTTSLTLRTRKGIPIRLALR